MIRALIFSVIALLGTPAAAQTEHVVTGASPPTRYAVCAGDRLILKTAIGRELLSDGSRLKGFDVWVDRSRSKAAGNGFETVGATRLWFVENVQGKGWVYALIDAKPCVDAQVRPQPQPQPQPQPTKQSPTRFGVNLEGCTFVDNGALCPTVEDLAWYIDKAGFQSIRLPFNGFQAKNPVVMQRIVDLTNAATSRGVPIVLDRHDYTWPAPAEQVAFWLPILRRVNNPELVMVDLMNEPRGFDDPVLTNDWMQWVRDTNQIVAGIRKAGF